MAQARVNPEDIDYINAHGTSTSVNDSIETLAIKRPWATFGLQGPDLISTKSMMGHLIAAGGGVEAIICLLAMRDGVVPPTVNLDNPDDRLRPGLRPPRGPPSKAVDVALSNSFGFGGQNVTLILRRTRRLICPIGGALAAPIRSSSARPAGPE